VQKTCTQTKLRPLECLKYYFSCGIIFPVTVLSSFAKSPIYCFSDNLSVITNVSDMLNPCSLWPQHHQQDIVYLAICMATYQCAPIQLSFQHVKYHKDKDPKYKLTTLVWSTEYWLQLPSQRYASTTNQLNVLLGNLAIPDAQPHLSFTGIIICQNYLLISDTQHHPQTITTISIKIHLTQCNTNAAQWLILHLALKSFSPSNQCFSSYYQW